MIITDKDELFKALRKRSQEDRYEWNPRPGFSFEKKADAEVVGQHIEKLAEENGGVVNTAMLVTDGDNATSPLHPLFEHDMEVAASNWRFHEARNLIGSLVVVKMLDAKEPGGKPESIRVRAFPHIISNGERSYTPVFVAARVPDLQRQIIEMLLSEARAWQKRASEFSVFSTVVEAIDKLPAIVVD